MYIDTENQKQFVQDEQANEIASVEIKPHTGHFFVFVHTWTYTHSTHAQTHEQECVFFVR